MSIGPNPRPLLGVMAVAALAMLAPQAARAQAVCRTSNCSQATPPAECRNRATPRIATVHMTGLLAYSPSEPKIEPADCVEWIADAVTHSSTADPCAGGLCTAPSGPGCSWESGNVSFVDTTPSVVCAYDPAVYPPESADGFYCRFHDNAAHLGTMHGTLHVTTPIQLTVNKDAFPGDVVLAWTGGGILGDITYKVVRSDSGNPAFPAGDITLFDPDGGSTGTLLADKGELANTSPRLYLVRNRQTNEGSPSSCQPPDCDDLDPCTIDSCLSGTCLHDPAPDGTPCEPLNPYAVCLGGVCTAP